MRDTPAYNTREIMHRAQIKQTGESSRVLGGVLISLLVGSNNVFSPSLAGVNRMEEDWKKLRDKKSRAK